MPTAAKTRNAPTVLPLVLLLRAVEHKKDGQHIIDRKSDYEAGGGGDRRASVRKPEKQQVQLEIRKQKPVQQQERARIRNERDTAHQAVFEKFIQTLGFDESFYFHNALLPNNWQKMSQDVAIMITY